MFHVEQPFDDEYTLSHVPRGTSSQNRMLVPKNKTSQCPITKRLITSEVINRLGWRKLATFVARTAILGHLAKMGASLRAAQRPQGKH